ncbi:FecR family protein [Paracidovorax anthurii]|uniref:FecR family protein n=1 Tax=Paracidovorax anthurii TaxID=78229 RepID=A0A328Z4D2_9BURK|nr:FecR domain-containing protein [Paracidovorax anthurii]RAR80991.1 FecR family protein [Paracidovorax anthurii]
MNPAPDDARRLHQEATQWFVRRRDAGWRTEDERAFQAWLGTDPRHAPAYERCGAQWTELDGMPGDLLARLRRDLDGEPRRGAEPPRAADGSRRRFLAWPAMSAATVAAAAVVACGGYMAWQHFLAQPLSAQAYRTERGQQRSVQLADGSRLRLDTATRLEVTFYRGRREARLLDGQAEFEVQPDKDRPFQVLAGPLQATVVGTRFSVRYTPEIGPGASVAVEEGKVRVTGSGAAGAARGGRPEPVLLLTAGQQAEVDSEGTLGPLAAVPAGGIAPWRERRVSFVDTPLAEALAELERYRDTGLRVRDPRVAALRLSGTFDPMDPGGLRRALPRVLPVRLREHDGVAEVLPAN